MAVHGVQNIQEFRVFLTMTFRRVKMVGFTRAPKPRSRVAVQTDVIASPPPICDPTEAPSDPPPHLPIEVLGLAIDMLDDVRDFCNVAQTCQEWRVLLHSLDRCWEKAFLRDFGERNVEDYAALGTWREKYMYVWAICSCRACLDPQSAPFIHSPLTRRPPPPPPPTEQVL